MRFRSRSTFVSFFFIEMFFFGCSLEKAPLANISGHLRDIQGVAHGIGAEKGERYCHYCHGEKLQGGVNGEPSCYRCHGRHWQASGFEGTFAPADHTQIQLRFYHHPNLNNPLGTCGVSGCHGETLNGDQTAGTPSCYLCHGRVWN